MGGGGIANILLPFSTSPERTARFPKHCSRTEDSRMLGNSRYVPSRLLIGLLHPIVEHVLNGSSTLAPFVTPALAVGAVALAYTDRGALAIVCLGLASWFALTGYMRFVVAQRLVTREIVVDTGGVAAPLTLAFFSDAHLGRYKSEKWLARVVARVNAYRPDAVLIGGDFFFNRGQIDPDKLLAPMASLVAPLGAYAIYGNHDVGFPGRDRRSVLGKLLPGLGVRVLSNELVRLSHSSTPRTAGMSSAADMSGTPTWLGGMGELWRDNFKFGEVRTKLDATGEPGPLIVLAHNPDAMHELGPADRADLFLFGHTHAGQIRVPFLPGFGIPARGPLYRGAYRLPQGNVYVTSGMSCSSRRCHL